MGLRATERRGEKPLGGGGTVERGGLAPRVSRPVEAVHARAPTAQSPATCAPHGADSGVPEPSPRLPGATPFVARGIPGGAAWKSAPFHRDPPGMERRIQWERRWRRAFYATPPSGRWGTHLDRPPASAER